MKFPVFTQLAGNFGFQRRVRSRLPPPAVSLRTFGPGVVGDRCNLRLYAGKEAGQREQVAETSVRPLLQDHVEGAPQRNHRTHTR